MKETPKHQNPFKITLDGKPVFYAENVTITSAIDESSTKDLDSFSVRDHISMEESKPWPTSFTFETTMEPSPSFRRFINQMLGRVRPNRGSSRTMKQRLIRTAHYWRTIGVPWYIKPVYTLADYRISNPNKPPF